MILSLIILFIIIFLLVLLSMVWPPDSPWSPWWRTSNSKARQILSLAKVTKKDVMYELGSGEGRVLIVAAKDFGARGVGVEIDPIRVFVSRLLIRLKGLSPKIKIVKGNLFDEDLSQATVVYTYLVPKALNKLIPKFKKELRPGTRIISLKYKMNLELVSRKDDLYLYKV